MTPKQMEAEVFARATRAIHAAETGSALDRARAVADNRRLWDAVARRVATPPTPCRRLARRHRPLALAVIRECDAPEPDLGFIAEMNDQLAAGLWR